MAAITRKFISTCLFLLAMLGLQAQDPQFFSYGIADGLPSNQIYELKVASDGYLWLGTESGLVRFNGSRFVHFKPGFKEETGMTQLFEHPRTGIYCRTFDGRLFLARGDSLLQIPIGPGMVEYRILGDQIYHITAHRLMVAGLLGQDSKVIFQSGEANEFLHILNDSLILGNQAIINFRTEEVTPLSTGQWSFMPSGDQAYLHRKSDPNLYRLDDGVRLSIVGTSQAAPLPPCKLTQLLQTEGEFLSGSFCGVYRWGKQNAFFTNSVITDIEIDQEGNYWFSTLGDGLLLVPHIAVLEFKRGTEEFQTRPDKILTDRKGTAYVWCVGAIYRYRPGQVHLELLHQLPNKKECQVAWLDEVQNTVYFESGGFYEWRLDRPENPPRRLGDMNIKSIARTPWGLLTKSWNFFGLLRQDGRPSKGDAWLQKYLGEEIARNGDYALYPIQGLEALPQGAKACAFDDSTETFILGYATQTLLLSRNGFRVLSVAGQDLPISAAVAYEGSFIVAAKGGGIWVLAPGMPPSCILEGRYYADRKVIQLLVHGNKLWVVLMDRIISMDLQGHTVPNPLHTRETGNYEYRDLCFGDKTIWIATNEGLLNIPASLNAIDTVAPRMHNVQILSSGIAVPISQHGDFAFDDNELRIILEGIHYRSRGNFIFKAFLAGYDSEPQTILAQNPVLQYKRLPPGDYNLQVYAQNLDGYQSPPFQYAFTIQAPYWQQAWFYVLMIVLLAVIGYALARWYAHSEQRRNLMEMQLVESKLTSLKAQMNPHFIFNALGSIQFLVLKGEVLHANTYLGKFSKLMRMVLEMSEWKTLSLADEIQSLSLYLELEKLRMGEQFTYVIDVAEDLQTETVKLPPLLIQPYVENAVRHGLLHKTGEKLLRLTFSIDLEKSAFICAIDDNGIGREASAKLKAQSHRSFANLATANRLTLYNRRYPGHFQITYLDRTSPDTGTRVTISLPLDFRG